MKNLFLIALCSMCFNSYSQTLIGWWKFQSGSAADASGHGLNGTISGSPVSVSGADGTPNSAMRFNGSTDYITVPFDPIMQMDSWTIMAMVRPQGFYTGTCQANAILWRGQEFTSDHYSLYFTEYPIDFDCYVATPDSNVFSMMAAGTSTGNPWINGPRIVKNKWYCVIATYDHDTASVYVNGIRYVHFYWPNQYTSYNTNPISIARSLNPSFPYYFNGDIDEIKLYSGLAVPDEQIANKYCSDFFMNKHKTTDVKNINENSVSVYPNPLVDKLNVSIDGNSSATLYIYNSLGQEVKKDHFQGHITIDIQYLNSGIYFLKILGGTLNYEQKLIKE